MERNTLAARDAIVMRWLWITACLILISLATHAHADGELDAKMKAADKARLAGYAKVRDEAIAEAKNGGAAADIAVLDEILAGEPLSLHGDFDATGKWKCQT